MNRRLPVTLAATLVAVTLLSAAPKFKSVWMSPDAGKVSFLGTKVAALVIAQDDSLRVAGEEALVRELTARGMEAVATYRIAPKEELRSADRAKEWFSKANVSGVVAMRPVSNDKRTTHNPGMWVSPSYSTLWGYYNYGWGSVYIPGSVQSDTIVVVETTIFSVSSNTLLWAAVSETKNPKTLPQFIEDLVKETVKEMQKKGLAKNTRK